MKETLYTIPVNDGFLAGGECPFCNMWDKLDRDAVQAMLGPAYMEDDVRAETDARGFCGQHYKDLMAHGNRLGMALMLYTHVKRAGQNLDNPKEPGKPCYICAKVDNTFGRFLDTFFYLWKKDDAMRETVAGGQGFCVPHFRQLMEISASKLNRRQLQEFSDVIVPLQQRQMKRLEDELDRFIQKFDYRNADMPWETAKDALPRGIQKAASIRAIERGRDK